MTTSADDDPMVKLFEFYRPLLKNVFWLEIGIRTAKAGKHGLAMYSLGHVQGTLIAQGTYSSKEIGEHCIRAGLGTEKGWA